MQRTPLAFIFAAGLLAACQSQSAPKYASSAEEPAYAERYPETLAAIALEFEEDDARVTADIEKFSTFPGELTEPKWRDVATLYDRADDAGTRADFASQMEETESIERFYAESRDKIRQKVIGAANYAAKQKPCEVELSGPIAGSLDKAMERELEERARAHNPAHRYLADHEESLGKKNLEKLEEQVDAISKVSYIVRTKMPRAKQALEALIEEEPAVRRTLDLQKLEAQATLNDLSTSKTAKARAEERAQATDASLARLDADVEKAKALLPTVEDRAAEATKRYQKEFDLLQVAVEDKVDQAHAKSDPKKQAK